MNQLSVLIGALNYEFRMQVRRRAVWITILLISALTLAVLLRSAQVGHGLDHLEQLPILVVVANWSHIVNLIIPIGVGALMADRLPRDFRTKANELFTTLPGALGARLIGKYLGSMLATLAPMFVFYLLGVIYIVVQTHNMLALPLSLVTFAAIALPGAAFICAFSLACTAVIWVPLYQFCFIGYWFWGNHLGTNTGIPTLSQTLLTPAGKYIEQGFFHNDLWWGVPASPLLAVESMLLLVGFAVFALFVLWNFLKWQQARQ